jgi:uncharacterized protein (DUF849 family)
MNRRQFITTSVAGAGALTVAGPVARAVTTSPRRSIEDTPVILECAISGSTTKSTNSLAPETVAEQVAEIGKCLDAGATIVHTHSNRPDPDPKIAARFYADTFRPIRKKYPHAILYATANFDPKVYNRMRTTYPGEVQCGHHRILAEAGLANMVLMDMGVVPLGVFDKQGVPGPDEGFFWYGFWPDDVRTILQICKDYGTGTSISVFEPGWMKNVVAMARAGTLPRGSKLNIYFATDSLSAMAPAIPEALELYLKMMEGLDLKWSVGYIGKRSVMDTPLARMALERGGSFRVGLEDWATGPSNVDQLQRAKELINSVGRQVVTGAEAIEYLDIPFAATRP